MIPSPPRRDRTILLTGCVLLLSVLFPLLTSAEEEMEPRSLTITQKSPLRKRGTWTLLKPTQETVSDVGAARYSENGLLDGRYTIFIKSPQGTETHIELHRGGSLSQTVDHPQISFEVTDDAPLRVDITYTLVLFGRIGVTSDPPGIPFTVRGPDSYIFKGITPTTLKDMPAGVYAVQYETPGCNPPPPKSDELRHGASVYFSILIRCDKLKTVEKTTDAPLEHEGSSEEDMLLFDDVPRTAWFAPHVYKAVTVGILSGYKHEDGSLSGMFGPGNPVTIAELSAIVHRLAGLDETKANLPRGGRKEWFTPFIASARDADWVIYIDASLNPLRPATRGEVLVTVLQALDIPLRWPKGTVFKDVKRRTPYAAAIETGALDGIVSGKATGDGTSTGFFGPEEHVTRAEIAKMLEFVIAKYRHTPSR